MVESPVTRQNDPSNIEAAPSADSAEPSGGCGKSLRTEIEAPPLRIRTYRADDVDAVHEAVTESIAELSRWMPWCHADYRREETEAWVGSRDESWAKADEYSFVIEDATTGELLGGCGVNEIHQSDLRGNLGYWVRTGRTRRGIASTATRALAAAAMVDLGLERIEIAVALDNRASQRTAEKAGARREGIARRAHRVHGHQRDMVIFSLVREDFGIGRAGV